MLEWHGSPRIIAQTREFALGSWRFRVGDYRVVFDIEGKKIIVLRVGHRREVYR